MPSGQNPWNQSLKKKRRRNAGSLEALRRQLWAWLAIIDDGITNAADAGDAELCIKWLHAASQLSGTYTRITIDSDLEARLKALEARLNEPLQ